MEGKTILYDKKILYAGGCAWAEPAEQHIMIELLSASNETVWANPYGKLTGPLLPRITTLKEGLTIYNPGVNFLAIPSLGALNERRRLLQVKLYLIGRDFEPDLVWIDAPLAARFTAYYGKKGALTFYYAAEDLDNLSSRAERKKLTEAVDLVITPSPKLHKKYKEQTGKAYLLSGGDLIPPPETEDDEPEDELVEKAFMEALQKRLEEISRIVEKEMAQKSFFK